MTPNHAVPTAESQALRVALYRAMIETAGRYLAARELSPRELARVLGIVERVGLELLP